MGLFDKKYCDICGAKIGLLGNKKLEDGNCCKDCVAKLSPFFSERRSSTIAEIQEQLAYREENKKLVAAFTPTKSFPGSMNIYIDEGKNQWIATRSSKWQQANPDVMDISQVTSVDFVVDENKTEVYMKDKDGKSVSYNPKKYKTDYDFDMTICVNHPYFNEIKFSIAENIESRIGQEYRDANRKATEIKKTLSKAVEEVREAAATAAKPKTAVVCPFCKATTIPDDNGCCEYCGTKL